MIQRVASGRDLSRGAVSDLEATLTELASRGVTGLFLDTERVVSFDSEALEALLELSATARSRDLAFAVVNPSEVLRVALGITGLVERIDVRDDESAAETADLALVVEAGDLPPTGDAGAGDAAADGPAPDAAPPSGGDAAP